jgi:uncharacterized repeat protein (TIGR03803 family)
MKDFASKQYGLLVNLRLRLTLLSALVPVASVVVGSMMFVTPLTQAQSQTPAGYSLKVLHNFDGPNGNHPISGPVREGSSNLYGTTQSGGAANLGTVFKVDAERAETVLHSFSGSDGTLPSGPLVQDASGNLYGTAALGGNLSDCQGSGCGVVFKIDAGGKFTVLYAFTGTNGDGILAGPGLLLDSAGNLYGTTQLGGDLNCSTGGGYGCGTVFKVDPTGKETVLYNFTGARGDGAEPWTTLAMDSAGYVYGTTQFGGVYSGVCAIQNGCGTVWKLNPTTRKETVLRRFNANHGDGADPNEGGMFDAQGNFFGTAWRGGNLSECPSQSVIPGCGIVFRIDTSGKYSVLHKFRNSDGANPQGPLIQDKKGNFYGVTAIGGAYSRYGDLGGGTVFKMSASDNKHFRLSTLFNFTLDGSEPQQPNGAVVQDAEGNLYGIAQDGGGWSDGAVFKLTVK